MTDSLGTTPPLDATPPTGDNRRRNIIIIVVVAAVLLCCCCLAAVGAWWLWTNGDQFLGNLSQVLPALRMV